jgi:hypothetical protein
MKSIDLLHINFTKKDLGYLPEEEAIFLLQVGGLIHEVISLQKFIHMSSHGVENNVQRLAENSQAMYFFRLLAGTLYEGWKLVAENHNEYKIIIAKYKIRLSPPSRAAYDKLANYFSNKKNSCERIRNNFSHHYNFGEIRKMFRSWPDDGAFDIYLSEVHANCRYAISDVITNLALLGKTDIDDIADELASLTKEIGEIAKAFIELISEYLSIILISFIEAKQIQKQDVKIPEVPSLDELRLHYFVANPES